MFTKQELLYLLDALESHWMYADLNDETVPNKLHSVLTVKLEQAMIDSYRED